ncbi:MAG: hypothetical protein AB7N24_24025 [Dehalococcoidia bacterium]
MAFILAKERSRDVLVAFRRYHKYLEGERHRFPAGALSLATSEWYFDPADRRCPHDAWLLRLGIEETGRGNRNEVRSAGISIELLGAYHDHLLTLRYSRVYRYALEATGVGAGHADWRYDEFRVNEQGHLEHEIEWSAQAQTARWLIEADDVVLESSAIPGDA